MKLVYGLNNLHEFLEMILETRYYVAELKDNIIWVQYKPNLHLTLKDAEQIVDERLLYYQDLQAPVLIKSAKIKVIDKEARDYLFDKEKGLKNLKAIAIVYSNILNKLMATILFYRHTPGIPHRMFKDEQEALGWLKQYV